MELWGCLGNQGFYLYVGHYDQSHDGHFHEVDELNYGVGHDGDLGVGFGENHVSHEDYGVLHDGNLGEGHDGDHVGHVGHEVPGEGRSLHDHRNRDDHRIHGDHQTLEMVVLRPLGFGSEIAMPNVEQY